VEQRAFLRIIFLARLENVNGERAIRQSWYQP